MQTHPVVELLGDGISPELQQSVHTVAAGLPCRLEFTPVDLSVASRARRGTALYDEAVERIGAVGVALKYPTDTVAESPNQVLRDRLDFSVIHRPVATIPGIPTNFVPPLDVDIVRIATGGTYEDAGRRVGSDSAVSIRLIERRPCLEAAWFAFRLAQSRGTGVVSASKYTIQRATDGLFEEVVGEVRQRFPAVAHRKELFDALCAGIIMHPDRYGVIVLPNEYGDILSDLCCGLVGSIGLGASTSLAFGPDLEVRVALFDPAGGTAPQIAGQDLCNPTAALLSLANLLRHVGETDSAVRLQDALGSAIAEKRSTRDVGGTLSTREFTSEVVRRMG